MQAKDYAISNPYTPPTHNGVDRAMPTGTPIIINGTTIGLSGNTGFSTGPHLHTQAGRDFYAQNVINPAPYEFKGDTVVQTGRASEWGLYVIVKYQDVYIVYAHLSEIKAQVGTKLGGDDMSLTRTRVKNIYRVTGEDPTDGKIDLWYEKPERELTLALLKRTVKERNKYKALNGDMSRWATVKALLQEAIKTGDS